MAGESDGCRAGLVRRRLTPGLISSLFGTAGSTPFISFSTSYPELDSAYPCATVVRRRSRHAIMKALAFLFIAHLVVCGVAADCFHERSTTIQKFDPPRRASPPEPDGGGWFAASQTETDFRIPAPVVIYGTGGLLALFIALGVRLYRHAL
jgi:hypothetical protein